MKEFIKKISVHRSIALAFVAIVLVTLPLILVLLNHQQDLRQRAAFDQSTSSHDIAVVSEVPGYNLILLDKSDLLQLLSSWGIFGQTYTTVTYHPSKHPVLATPTSISSQTNQINTITVHLVDDAAMPLSAKDPQGELVKISSFMNFNNGNLDVFVAIPMKVLSNDQVVKKGFIVQKQLFIQIFQILARNNPQTRTQKVSQVQQALSSQIKQNQLFFDITKQ